MATWPRICAANNAGLCDLVCRTHGARTRFDDDAWTSRTRTPTGYPDAVTLVPRPSVSRLFARIDTSAGCSIKDSFASLDLTTQGFRVLFDAQWIVRSTTVPEATAPDPSWEVVRDPEGLARWEKAWGGNGDRLHIFRHALAGDPSVAVLAARDGQRIVAGAILNQSSGAVGVSNVFVVSGGLSETWSACIVLAQTLFPGSTLVGYESGAALEVAREHGFGCAGPLRVWIKSDGDRSPPPLEIAKLHMLLTRSV